MLTRGHHCPGGTVEADAIAGGVTRRVVEPRRARRVVLVRKEVRRLQPRVVGRLQPLEAHAVVERQPGVHAPVVLRVPLDVVIQEVAFDPIRGLRVVLVDAHRRIREREAGIERVRRIVDEVTMPFAAARLLCSLTARFMKKPTLPVCAPITLVKLARKS